MVNNCEADKNLYPQEEKSMGEISTAINGFKHEVRFSDWSERIEAQQASGMTVKKWCEKNGIKPKTFYYHLRKHREKSIESAPTIVPLGMPKCTSDIRIEKQDLQITLPTDISPQLLIALVHELC